MIYILLAVKVGTHMGTTDLVPATSHTKGLLTGTSSRDKS